MIETMENPVPVIDESVYHEPYVVKDGCLCERIKVKEQVIEVKLADFVPVLKAEITLDDGAEQRKLFRVAGTYKDGTLLSEQIVSADEMQSMKWLLQRWGSVRRCDFKTECVVEDMPRYIVDKAGGDA